MGIEGIRILIIAHCIDDLVPQARDFLVLGIDLVLQPFTHVTLAVIAGLHSQRVLAQGLFAHRLQ